MGAHRELEERIASWKGLEAALVFSTGYQANQGVIPALLGPDDLVLSDELNHASIIDATRLSRARVEVFRHNDLDHLEERLGAASAARRVLIATESVFSMDGDRAPLQGIVELAERHGAWTLVDEAHGAGVFGRAGRPHPAALPDGKRYQSREGEKDQPPPLPESPEGLFRAGYIYSLH